MFLTIVFALIFVFYVLPFVTYVFITILVLGYELLKDLLSE